jgi:hypothetical protein
VISSGAIIAPADGRLIFSGAPKSTTVTSSVIEAGAIEFRSPKKLTLTSDTLPGTSIGGPAGMPGTTLFVSDSINISSGRFADTTIMSQPAGAKSKSLVINSVFLPGAELGGASFPTIRVTSLGSSDVTVADNAAITATKSLNITSGGNLTIGNGVTIAGQGKAKTVSIVSNGDMTIGDSGTFGIASGSFLMLADGTITGGTGNEFLSGGKRGGGIMFGSNITDVKAAQETLISAFKLSPGTAPAPAELGGNDVMINNGAGTTGVVHRIPPVGGGTVDLTSSSTHSAILNANQGAMVFDASPPGASIQFDGVTITVDNIVPIAYRSGSAPFRDFSVDSRDQEVPDETGFVTIGRLFIEGSDRAELLNAPLTGRMRTGKAKATISVLDGVMLLHALVETTINTQVATVRIDRGALVSVHVTSGTVRVAALSGPGHVTVLAAKKRIGVGPGREALISNHDLAFDERTPCDGVGRRAAPCYKLGNGLSLLLSDFSIVSMLANADHTGALRHPISPVERHVARRLVKTAAVIQHLGVQRGAYTARPAERRGARSAAPTISLTSRRNHDAGVRRTNGPQLLGQ